ncbi:hypothetical protein PLICRDRAFT_337026 [Plicaturopsis crispa FD-325 SS-3]|uniref:Uncharacterized protein n=1 Tax=Plicaturopsis crispa FD-325 SS-3 TaxID=944288 RepID=A0A0C9SLC4_PLICR|nr:hypothetical protein PLICRDRAFT_337026 [Plicaturopsis crispa FD-325 SS-3]
MWRHICSLASDALRGIMASFGGCRRPSIGSRSCLLNSRCSFIASYRMYAPIPSVPGTKRVRVTYRPRTTYLNGSWKIADTAKKQECTGGTVRDMGEQIRSACILLLQTHNELTLASIHTRTVSTTVHHLDRHLLSDNASPFVHRYTPRLELTYSTLR